MPVNAGPWMKKLQKMNITLTNVGEKSQPVQVLIGADLFGKFLTGQHKVLSCGLVGIETLSGKFPESRVTSSNAMLVTSHFIKELDISDLWKLDLIGIKDPIEKLSKKEQEDLTKEHFLQTVRYNDDKRYEVHLPWLDNYAPLPDNLELAIRRLESTTNKLLHENLYYFHEGKKNCMIDPEFTCNKHIESLITKSRRRLNILKYISGRDWGANAETLRTTYIALIRPILEYGLPVYFCTSDSN
ncbi:hypothetical protein AVEN_107039-1 [Araneus ventricosus]|uniref:Peptidase aspartic putative domain-containing protein n=1 Tax=Araneus ventricosus TaxID=182803 RepID=A0A4Y2M6A7_ARAVE|nr:hypothetical protein AVEN_107039-1 [Araneus ventricosus]